ncbi:MAG: FMN-binding negative transcriptional regulator [Thermomonas sp.]|uniref:FMN-binding negative transcriptional regulator n=1 Tax=Thermomonas sp. TaxID=1971895 RepID=UPI0039E3C95B
MYQPRVFVGTDLVQLDALFAADPFATLVTQDDTGAPFASHLPLLYHRDGDRVLVEGHWARPNPQARHAGDALLIVHGPHAYVSPGWYPDKLEAGRVPTWNYTVAHLRGRLDTFDDEASLGDLVARLSRHFEDTVGGDWEFDPADARQHTLLRGIVGFRFVPNRIDIKLKLSQNHPLGNRHAVIDALSSQEMDDARAVAALMRTTLP